jgi:RND family efflux transporter MFP subunit
MIRLTTHSATCGAMVSAVAALAIAACSPPRAQGPAASELPSVAVAKATRGDIAQVLTITAEFRPFQEIDVHAKVAGFLKSITVDVGDRVQTGQLLAVLEIPELQDEIQQDEAVIRHGEEEVRRAQADLERTQSGHEVAHLAATRLASVMKERPNLVAQQDIDEATGRDRVAEAQVSTARAALASAQQQVQVAKAGQNKTQTLFGYARITAPFAGVITHRYADTGAMIQAGTSSQSQAMPLVKLSQNSVLRLTIPVPESAVPRIHLGVPVNVTVAVIGKTFPGTVARFADKVDEQTRTMQTEVDVKNADLELVPGMYASVALTLAAEKNVITIPVEAVDRSGDRASVLTVDANGRLQTRAITLGLEEPDRIGVLSGLQDNDLVVVGNRSQLKAGSSVAPKVERATTTAGEK